MSPLRAEARPERSTIITRVGPPGKESMKFNWLSLVLVAALTLAGCGSGGSSASGKGAEPKSEDEKTLYALGLLLGANLSTFALSPAEMDFVNRGISDAATGAKPLVELQAYSQKVQELAHARSSKAAAAEKQKSEAFMANAAKEQGAQKTASGLIYQPIKVGTGANPTAADTVRVHYQGSLTDGTVFDSSIQRGQPVEFPLNAVIPCWSEGVQKMKVGEKAKLICPSSLAYGDQGRPPKIPGGATLVFEVELLGIVKK
jgi:FKBP-type peptidyl-prolyl cis-trans isomerase FkpA